jgi:hypothetical protein
MAHLGCFAGFVQPCVKYFSVAAQVVPLRSDPEKDYFGCGFQHPEGRKPGMTDLTEMEAQVVAAIQGEAAVNADYLAENLVKSEEADGWLEGGGVPVVVVVAVAATGVGRTEDGILVVPVATGSEDIVAAADIVNYPVVLAIVVPAAAVAADGREFVVQCRIAGIVRSRDAGYLRAVVGMLGTDVVAEFLLAEGRDGIVVVAAAVAKRVAPGCNVRPRLVCGS